VKRLAVVETDRLSPLPGLTVIRGPWLGCGADDAVWAIVGQRTASKGRA
jgi:hypothetical protein